METERMGNYLRLNQKVVIGVREDEHILAFVYFFDDRCLDDIIICTVSIMSLLCSINI